MDRHAYCIIAHSDHYCLKSLIELLDDDRNDIFLLLDKKASDELESGLKTSQSLLKIIDQSERIDIHWGHISQVEAELKVLGEAVEYNDYAFIHLISGCDLPIKMQDKIHDFFDDVKPDTLFVTINESPEDEESLRERGKYYYFFLKYQHSANKILKNVISLINYVSVAFQKKLGIRKNWGDYKLGKGSNWVTVSSEMVKYLLKRKDFILKNFRFMKCADEVFIQSEILNSDFKNKLYRNPEGLTDHLRYMEWCGDSPRVLKTSDYEMLISQPDMFARKFSSAIDRDIIDRLRNTIG